MDINWSSPATAILVLLLTRCGPVPDGRGLPDLDLTPPVFLGAQAITPTQLVLRFSEPVQLEDGSLQIEPPLGVMSVVSQENELVLDVETQVPGRAYDMVLTALDVRGNFNSLVTRIYGYNPRIPGLLINEFTTRGSATHPDLVELQVTADGNMGGVVLYQGVPADYTDLLVFPAFEVSAQEFLVIHFKPQNIPEEVDETDRIDISGGLDASQTARDFWVTGGQGLSGNNGVISLYGQMGGALVDGVLYSNRTIASDTRYGGFGTRQTQVRASALHAAGGWVSSGKVIVPEDGVNPEGSTSTRSMNRLAGADSDTREDWYVVPTRGSTFGAENSPEVYVP